MAQHFWHCRLCGVRTDNRVCWDCYNTRLHPCSECGKPTATITRLGKTASPACIPCTARLNAPTRCIGVTCRACGERTHDTDMFYQVCPSCQSIQTNCPVCASPMPKYRKKATLRVTCSNRCRKVLHPTTTAQARQAGRTRFAGHVCKSTANRIARERVEYRQWRTAVYQRDDYTCQDCGERGKELHPHHIQPFATHIDLRYEVSNGVTLCAACHRQRHGHIFIGRSRKRAPGQLRLPIAES